MTTPDPIKRADRTSLVAWLRSRVRDLRPIRLVPFRGYATTNGARILLRALRDPQLPPAEADDSTWENLLATFHRFESDEVRGLPIRAEWAGLQAEGVTDEEGYLWLNFPLPAMVDAGWQSVAISSGIATIEPVVGQILVPPTGQFGVISDIDDTVIEAGVANPLQLVKHMLLDNSHTRLPFPGVAAFYRALQVGVSGQEQHPFFYVSGSPWNFYELLHEIFERHGVPFGPLLLRRLEDEIVRPALSGRSSLRGHKLEQVTQIMQHFPDRQFILIGDSSQLDPEIYAEVLHEQPGRVAMIYIRDVTGDQRDQEVLALAEQIAAQGGALCYVADSLAMAHDAAARGLIAAEALVTVEQEQHGLI
jgi:phosphatidate phosphatase APP1